MILDDDRMFGIDNIECFDETNLNKQILRRLQGKNDILNLYKYRIYIK